MKQTQILGIMALQRIMAKQEIHKRTANILTLLWKRFMVGKTLDLPWPRGWSKPDDQGNSTQSADPNEHYRWWLEKHVGSRVGIGTGRSRIFLSTSCPLLVTTHRIGYVFFSEKAKNNKQ